MQVFLHFFRYFFTKKIGKIITSKIILEDSTSLVSSSQKHSAMATASSIFYSRLHHTFNNCVCNISLLLCNL